MTDMATGTTSPGWPELWRVFGLIGLISFGGPAAQIGLMHRELVERRGWLEERDYLSALSLCMLLPGPEAMQLATFAGWRLRGIRGGLLAGGLFVLPGATLMMALAAAYAAWGALPLAAALFTGVKACVAVIVVEALLRVARRSLTSSTARVISALAFLVIFTRALPFPAVVLCAALAGAVLLNRGPAPAARPRAPASHRQLGAVLAGGLALWVLPLAALHLAGQAFLVTVGLFFSRLALVTFGGAYAVLAYMADEVVRRHGWLTAGQMIDSLGLAETTPGPLILVTEFVAFLAGHGEGGWPLAVAAALVALWVTFLPCFLWIFALAPYADAIAARPRLQGALSGVTAAVVGVIGSLTLWFALHALFARVGERAVGGLTLPLPAPDSFLPAAAAIALVAGWLLLYRHRPLWQVLLVSAGLGLLTAMAG